MYSTRQPSDSFCRPPGPHGAPGPQHEFIQSRKHQQPRSFHMDDSLDEEALPPVDAFPAFQYQTSLHPLDTAAVTQTHSRPAHLGLESSLTTGLRLQAEQFDDEMREQDGVRGRVPVSDNAASETVYNAGLPVRTSSMRSVLSSRRHRTSSLTPVSVTSSPSLGPLTDMTPLPSPISLFGSPATWRRSMDDKERSDPSRGEPIEEEEEPVDTSLTFIPFTRIPSKKRKIPLVSRMPNGQEAQIYNVNAAHARHRSLSDYMPDGMEVPRTRNIAVSSGRPTEPLSPPDDQMHREEYLAIQRGLAIAKPPTPPKSDQDADSGDQDSPTFRSDTPPRVYAAHTINDGKMRRWRALRKLGQGTFSIVMLATSQSISEDEMTSPPATADPTTISEPVPEETQIAAKRLVAVKICDHGPAGGADENKVGISIKRELELMKAINHPSIIHLKATSILDRQTIIVESYCAGGDLFELASNHADLMMPWLIRRIFAELVAAVSYLHSQFIVHRDIKLENVLINLSPNAIPTVRNWTTYSAPLVTLTDLGLGRWIPKPPASALLQQPCGSPDYAAPEMLLGSEYDGRSTDAWALGIVLYALLEGRLPFDPVPGSRKRTPTSHKIARCDWQWVRYADEEGEWDPIRGQGIEGARECVEALIAKKRDRWDLARIGALEWVREAISVPGGLKRQDDDDDE